MDWSKLTTTWNMAIDDVYSPKTIRPSAKELADTMQAKINESQIILDQREGNFYD